MTKDAGPPSFRINPASKQVRGTNVSEGLWTIARTLLFLVMRHEKARDKAKTQPVVMVQAARIAAQDESRRKIRKLRNNVKTDTNGNKFASYG